MAINVGNTYAVTITEVVDGDTVKCTFPDAQTRTCQLFGIDSPESVYAANTWPGAYPSLPPSLQTQQFGGDAKTRLDNLIIGGTGSPTPVGLTVNATVRAIDADSVPHVTIENDLLQDVGAESILSGHAFVWDQYATTIPALYNIYKSNENTARLGSLVIWSVTPTYYPWDYRDDVDEAARKILYLYVTDTNPSNGSTGAYLDDDIEITFDQQVESSYLSSTFMKMYKTNAGMTTYEALACTYTGSGTVVSINPTVNLEAAQYYMLVLVGGPTGIKAVNGDEMEENYVLSFKAGSTVRPTTGVTTNISHVDIWVDADHTDDEQQSAASTDLFTTGEDQSQMPIVLLSTIPANHSVGVYNLSRIIFTYDDTIAYGAPMEALTGRYSDLPIDADPMGVRSVEISGVVVEQNSLYYDIETLEAADTLNREYTFTLSPNVVRGENKQGFDPEKHTIKFMGRLTPLYATPEQIRIRLSAWHTGLDTGLIDYDLYKLIHEKSLWTEVRLGTPATTDELIERNKLVICLVLYEMFAFGNMFGGNIKSRTLLMTQVQYYDVDHEKVLDELDDCIRGSLATTEYSSTIQSGIKSGKHIFSRQGKLYGVYR